RGTARTHCPARAEGASRLKKRGPDCRVSALGHTPERLQLSSRDQSEGIAPTRVTLKGGAPCPCSPTCKSQVSGIDVFLSKCKTIFERTRRPGLLQAHSLTS